jgi:FAD/FMN-containing dehydrogenase
MDEFIEKLHGTFSGEITTQSVDLDKYSRDASFFSIRPQVIVFPRTTADVITLVKITNELNAAGKRIFLTARSAGTDMSGGPLGESVIVEFPRHFNQIKEVGELPESNGKRGYVITQPGVYYRDFEKETLKKGFLLPSYPASRELCTIGGMMANNSGGEKSLEYGKTEDYIREFKVVLQDGNEYTLKKLSASELEIKKNLLTFEGEVYRRMFDLLDKNYDLIKSAKPNVSKNSAGYYLWNVYDKTTGTFDLTRLFVGSQGTLGMITEGTLELIKPQTHSRLLVVFLKDMNHLAEMTNHILQFKPESLESYDDHTFKLAVRLFPMMLKKLKGNAIMLGLRFLPEFWAVLTGGIPKLVVMAEFTADTDEEAHNQAVHAQESLKEFGVQSKIADSAEDIGKYWTIRRESFSMLRNHIKKLRTAPFIDDFVVKPEVLPEFLPKLYAILDEYKITYTIAGHVGSGNFHIIPLMDFTVAENEKTKHIIAEILVRVNKLIIDYKGSITGEHNDGIVRTPFLKDMYGPDIVKLFEETKKIFDPQNIFNPGKKVGGTWEYALEHIIKE